ncbi:MAG: 2Fe-2S iron-sulfur cluster-binding protein [Myxococcota bacterium]|nr:2Fe-2S iron-sulfur cluster-binding protein [Myxococcota bacterium]
MGRLRRLLGKVREKATEHLSEGNRDSAPATDSRHPLDPIPDNWNQAIKSSPDRELATGGVEVRFEDLGLSIRVASGTTLLDAAVEAGTDLTHYCGGMCSCGSCRVEILSGEVSPIDDMEQTTLDIVKENDQDRLACQTRALSDLVIRVPVDKV